jgi:hypothetical protein
MKSIDCCGPMRMKLANRDTPGGEFLAVIFKPSLNDQIARVINIWRFNRRGLP